jgi:hypothetical protein
MPRCRPRVSESEWSRGSCRSPLLRSGCFCRTRSGNAGASTTATASTATARALGLAEGFLCRLDRTQSGQPDTERLVAHVRLGVISQGSRAAASTLPAWRSVHRRACRSAFRDSEGNSSIVTDASAGSNGTRPASRLASNWSAHRSHISASGRKVPAIVESHSSRPSFLAAATRFRGSSMADAIAPPRPNQTGYAIGDVPHSDPRSPIRGVR